MEIRFYQNGAAFLAENEAAMLEREAVFQLLLFNATGHLETPLSADCYFGRVEQQGKACILFGQIGGFPITLYGVGEGLKEGAGLLARSLVERGWLPGEYIAGSPLCELFFDSLKALKPTLERQLKLGTDIMQLDEPADIPLVPGICRMAREEELPLVYAFVQGFHRDINGTEMVKDLSELYAQRIAEGKVFLFETPDGRVVSTARVARQLKRGVCLSGVYTPPEERGKGYATANVLALSKRLLAEGNRFVALFVERKNPISNHVYQKLGYRVIADSWQYQLLGG